jgi:2-polyprenyl-3-methyl-5-hydroxy-6-metoxy-1,4-benzoquinol methylase
MIKDTSYALVRRLDFIESALREYAKKRDISEIVIADIGCGTGELLTIPLARKLGPSATIYAYEPEAVSYSYLRQTIEDLGLNNVQPVQDVDMLEIQKYDAIIVSEVIEHVQNPVDFLKDFKKRLKAFGIMLITTPNGYGIFEIETLLFNSLDLIGVIPFLRTLKRKFNRSRGIATKPAHADTLAVSPHINFFSLAELYKILQDAGLSLQRIEGRNFAAGPFSDRIIDKSSYLIEGNSYLGKILPLKLATDWMVVAENLETQPRGQESQYSEVKLNSLQRIYTRYKRWLNLSLTHRQENRETK